MHSILEQNVSIIDVLPGIPPPPAAYVLLANITCTLSICDIPTKTPIDETKWIEENLLDAVRKLGNKNRQYPGRHATTIEALWRIFKGKSDNLPDDATTVPHQTSTNPTRPDAIWQAPRVHSKRSQAQTLMQISKGEEMPTEKGVEQPTSKGEYSFKKWY